MLCLQTFNAAKRKIDEGEVMKAYNKNGRFGSVSPDGSMSLPGLGQGAHFWSPLHR